MKHNSTSVLSSALPVLAGILIGTLLGSNTSSLFAAPAPLMVPDGGKCDPHDIARSSSGTICGTTVIYCAGAPAAHYPGQCAAPSPHCEHTNIEARAYSCPPGLIGSLFNGDGGSVYVGSFAGPFVLQMSGVSPACGEKATKIVTFTEANDPTKVLGQQLTDFVCDPCS